MIKRLIAAATAAAAAFAALGAPTDGVAAKSAPTAVEHIFTHELIYDTALAFSPSNRLRDSFDKDRMTAKEFSALLSSLYEKNYVLVSTVDAAVGDITLAEGKRAVALSFDDMTYDTVGRGCVDKIVFDGGKLSDYTRDAEPQITRCRENVTILESFIEAHPDFSHNGARATICVNGYNGILGYRVTPSSRVSDERMAEDAAQCKKTVAAMKALGYEFASHTYYHKYFDGMSAADIERDLDLWDKYIRPIVGDTRMLCFPSGLHNAKAAKFAAYGRHGFDIFLCVGSGATDYERGMTDATFVYRKPMDGTALRLYRKQYSHFVDTAEIYDGARHRPFSYKGGYY